MFMMSRPRGEHPESDHRGPSERSRRTVNEESMLAAIVALFAGAGTFMGTRSVIDAAVFTAIVFLVAFGVFTILKFVVAMPEAGATKPSPTAHRGVSSSAPAARQAVILGATRHVTPQAGSGTPSRSGRGTR